MSILPILGYDHPALTTATKEVDTSSPSEMARMNLLAADLIETSMAVNAYGIAANQVGSLDRIFVMTLPGHRPMAFINPKIVEVSDALNTGDEGCLSMKDIRVSVERHLTVVLEYVNLDGVLSRFEAVGWASIAAQHEYDHLDGIRNIDRVSPLRKMRAIEQYRKSKHKVAA